jgi:hypothetical protein
MFEENAENFFFERRVEAAYYDFIGLAYLFCPLYRTLSHLLRIFARGEKCNQVAVKQVFIT